LVGGSIAPSYETYISPPDRFDRICNVLLFFFVFFLNFYEPTVCFIIKGILSTKIIIFFIPKIIVVFRTDPHKMKINTELCCKRYDFLTKTPKTIVIGIIVQDNKNSNLFIWPSMWTRLEHAHCLETINNMWFLGKRESVNVWKKADFDEFREKVE
jgi:hypothetical protein